MNDKLEAALKVHADHKGDVCFHEVMASWFEQQAAVTDPHGSVANAYEYARLKEKAENHRELQAKAGRKMHEAYAKLDALQRANKERLLRKPRLWWFQR